MTMTDFLSLYSTYGFFFLSLVFGLCILRESSTVQLWDTRRQHSMIAVLWGLQLWMCACMSASYQEVLQSPLQAQLEKKDVKKIVCYYWRQKQWLWLPSVQEGGGEKFHTAVVNKSDFDQRFVAGISYFVLSTNTTCHWSVEQCRQQDCLALSHASVSVMPSSDHHSCVFAQPTVHIQTGNVFSRFPFWNFSA